MKMACLDLAPDKTNFNKKTMKSMARRPVLIWGFVTVGIVLIIAGFLRGYYLEGSAVGMVNVAITVCILWLLARFNLNRRTQSS